MSALRSLFEYESIALTKSCARICGFLFPLGSGLRVRPGICSLQSPLRTCSHALFPRIPEFRIARDIDPFSANDANDAMGSDETLPRVPEIDVGFAYTYVGSLSHVRHLMLCGGMPCRFNTTCCSFSDYVLGSSHQFIICCARMFFSHKRFRTLKLESLKA